MPRPKIRKIVIITLLITILFFIAYSIFYRNYLDSEIYLQIAWDYTGRDPHVLNWREPEFEIVKYDGAYTVHLTLHTDEDDQYGPYSLYIDPFKKKVVYAAPRD